VFLNSFSVAEQGISGLGGDVILTLPMTVHNERSDVRNLAILTFSSSSNAGTVKINAQGSSMVFNTSISPNRQVEVSLPLPESQIDLSIGEQDRSGNVAIMSHGDLVFNYSRIFSNAGDVAIMSRGNLRFMDSRILSDTSSISQAERITEDDIPSGAVTIMSHGNLRFMDSRILSDISIMGQLGSDGNPIRGITITSTGGGQITFNNSRIRSDTSTTDQLGSDGNPTGGITITSTGGGQITFNNSRIRSDGGGDIRLHALDSLTMEDESLIYTNAGEAIGGGNIIINTGRLFSDTDNNDIIAQGRAGFSGKIDIDTAPNGIVNFREQPERSFRNLRDNSTSDISGNSVSASGYLERDPTQGTVELPTDLIDASNLVAQGCVAGGVTTARDLSEFVITGRGGLSSSPIERLNDNTAVSNWMTLNPEATSPVPAVDGTIPHPIDTPILEAQGWAIDPHGDVILIADTPTVTPQPAATVQVNCSAARN